MRILVTRATEFVGIHLAKRLAQTDHEMHRISEHTGVSISCSAKEK